MGMKVVKLHLYCNMQEAMTVIEFIDQLREAVVEQYADDIQVMMQLEADQQSDQIRLPFDDPIDF
ncbi:hypothetical protein AB833_28235 [Chromatiales bacterium (ex Bugula neritina AB1)]|nr:hypothetical protein AB833_28235 [Chromatiales bacterium (ex Bugula neritina AB1)]